MSRWPRIRTKAQLIAKPLLERHVIFGIWFPFWCFHYKKDARWRLAVIEEKEFKGSVIGTVKRPKIGTTFYNWAVRWQVCGFSCFAYMLSKTHNAIKYLFHWIKALIENYQETKICGKNLKFYSSLSTDQQVNHFFTTKLSNSMLFK